MISILDITGLSYFWSKISEKLGLKADASSVYTKTEVETIVENMARFGDTVGSVND